MKHLLKTSLLLLALLLPATAECSSLIVANATAFLQNNDLAQGEWAWTSYGDPATVGQATNDHLFVRGDYDDSGEMQTLTNIISFFCGTPQVVGIWLDDDEIYLNDRVQALTPVLCDEDGNLYNEITYYVLQADIYLPMSMRLITYKFPGESERVKTSHGDRMPMDAVIDWEEKGTKEVDGMTYRVYTIIVSNQNNDACHFSGKDGEMYAESGALKKDDAPLLYIAIENDNQDQPEGRLAQDMIIANIEFSVRECVRDNWTPNDYRFIYGEGGNNETQRFQYYNRVALYGSNGIDNENVLATNISLNMTSIEVTEGNTMQLTATVLPSNTTNKTVIWTTSNSSVATVNSNGLVTAKAVGTATITARTIDGTNLSASCVVTVNPNVVLATSISLNKTDAELTKGSSMELTATVLPSNTTNKSLKWSSNNPAVASVDENGLVTALAVGTATITATTTDGSNLSAICTVTVDSAIEFADATVKALCIQNWDANGDGELSLNEAAAVTNLNYVFQRNTSISSFNELEYFIGLTSIGNSAFVGCSGLTSITIPAGVTSIGNYAFKYCSGLTSITIPESVTYIGNSAFVGCNSLDTLIFNAVSCADFDDFTMIDERPFYNLNISTINIGENVQNIPAFFAYGLTNLTSITIPESVTSIGDYAFCSCTGLTSITIPSSVTTIGNAAFNSCSGLMSITIPEGVTSIGEIAFRGCSGLTSITIPESVISIGDFTFASCSELETITVNVNNSVYDSRDNCNAIIKTSDNQLISGCKNTIIPSSVTSIGDEAFFNCCGLTSITIPESVTSIGYDAFDGCSGLTSITIPEGVTSIGNYAFQYCSGLNEVYSYISDPSQISMGYNVFYRFQNYYSRTLYVPAGSLAAYQADTRWSKYFGSIVEMGLVNSIELNYTAVELAMNESLQLTATLMPEDATNKTVNWSSNNPTVASVDDNGLVTALAVGTATITATTTDGSNLSASCVVTVTENLTDYDNYLSLDNVEAFHGDTIVIPVKMTNDESIISFQTDIFLPEGLELLQEDGEYIIDPSSRMTRTHSIMSDDVSSGAIRVLCYSSNYKPFTGNSGDDLFYLTVKVADNAEGDYAIQLKNTLFTTSEFEEIAAPDVTANVNVKAYLLGDANNSGTVTVTDVVVTSQYILEQNPNPFVFEAADVNIDGNITITDVSRIVWMVLNPTLRAPLRAPALWKNGDRMSGSDITLAAGETRRVSIMLDNEMDYAAFQLDLNLPAGLTASNFELTDRTGSHAFDVNTLQNGNIRALCYSPAMAGIGHEGALLTFDVTATAPVIGDITVDGIELVTTACQTVKLDGFTIGVNNTSSINETVNGKAIAKVEYFNLAGQRIDRPENGVTLVVTTYTDCTRSTTKLIR